MCVRGGGVKSRNASSLGDRLKLLEIKNCSQGRGKGLCVYRE